MSKVEKLVNTYNPKGVVFDQIGHNVISLPKEILKNNYIQKDGDYPVINSGRDIQGFYNKYNNDGDAFTVASRGESAGFIQYSDIKFWAGGLCYPYRAINNNTVITKYLYYYLKKIEKSIMTNMVMRGGIPAINKKDFEKLIIPLPHIKVQEEIVKILDSFTNLIDALNEELSLRQKQFEYYREKLLTFDDNTNMQKICNFATIQSGKNKERTDNGQFPLFGSTGLISRTNIYVYEGDYILIARVGANAGFTYRVNGKFDVSDNTLIVTIIKNNTIF